MIEYDTYGQEVFCDCWDVDFDKINDTAYMNHIMMKAIDKCGATMFGKLEKEFSPNGLTILFGLEESHITAHSYPSKGFIALNCYTCGKSVDPNIAIEFLIDCLKPKEYFVQRIIRGVR